MQIRLARPEEAEILTDLSMRSKQSNGYDDDFMDSCREELSIHANDFQSRTYWVAEGEGIRGVIGLVPDENGKSGEVCGLFIVPEWKRKGIGRQLWNTLVSHAESKGFSSLWLDADPAAVPFYEGLGLSTVGTVPSGSIKGRELPRMVFDLGQVGGKSMHRQT